MKQKLILSAVLLCSNNLFAESYDLQGILSLAKMNNKEIKLAEFELKNATENKNEALSNALPKIDLDFGYNRNFLENAFYVSFPDSNGNTSTQKFKTSFDNQFSAAATLNQTIYSFGKVGNAIVAASYYKKLTKNQFDFQTQNVITNVKRAFYQTLLLRKVFEVAKDSEQSAKENYENIKVKYESDVVSEFELLQSEVRWQNSIPETIKAEKNYKLSANNLKSFVGLSVTEELDLKGDFELFPAMPEKLDFESILENRNDFNSLIWEKKVYEKALSIQFANHLPSIDGNLTYSYQAGSDDFKLENDSKNFFAGISLKVPVYSGGLTNSQVQKAKIEVGKVETRILMLTDQIKIQLSNSYLKLSEAQKRISASSKSVSTAKRAFEIAESRTKNGFSTQLELKDSRIFLDQAKLNYYSAIYDYLDAYFEWELITGKTEL
ncbi:TolC family protein [bacterium]|nr:TolC family protein [bacterium]